MGLYVVTERFTLYITLITFVLLGNQLSGGVVFSMAQLFNTMQLYMCILFPYAISSYAELRVTIKRLQEFLLKKSSSRSPLMNILKKNTQVPLT